MDEMWAHPNHMKGFSYERRLSFKINESISKCSPTCNAENKENYYNLAHKKKFLDTKCNDNVKWVLNMIFIINVELQK
jgi:hypothetical protein